MIDPRRPELKRVVLAVCGASGLVIALRLAQVMTSIGVEVHAIVSREALTVADHECGSRVWFLNKLSSYVKSLFSEDDWGSPLASSSFLVDACIAAPASMKSVAALAHGMQGDLLTRALGNCLRMRRPLVIVFRECPLGVAELRSLLTLAEMGAHIVPAVVGFYAKPQSLREVVDFIVGKVLDVLGIENDLYPRWGQSDARTARTLDPCRALYD